MRSALTLAGVLAVLLGLTVSVSIDQASAGAAVSIHPRVTYASPGEIIRVYLWKDVADSLFDGYETVLTFNPSDLQLQLGAAEESVMTKNCSNRWWYTRSGPDTVFISHVRMCPPNTVVSGPGALSSLSFKVLREGRIVISKKYFWLTRAGYWIQDITWEDALVLAGTAGVNDDAATNPGTPSILAYPNPGHRIAIQVWPSTTGRAGAEPVLEIHDVGGCLVRSLAIGSGCAGSYSLTWDGTDRYGRPCSPGIYYLSLANGGGRAATPVILIR
jgi:hypothetical protein